MQEAQLIASDNQSLREGLEASREEIAKLQEQLQRQAIELQRMADIEFANLQLQAQILALERERAPEPSADGAEDVREAYEELKKQHEVLAGYYSELLDYVKGNADGRGT